MRSIQRSIASLAGTLALAAVVASESATSQEEEKERNPPGPVGIAQQEALRRQQQIKSAQELFTTAEFDRQEGNFEEAIGKYRTAFQSLPAVPAAREFRETVFDRYQRAAVEYARQLIDKAEWNKAEETLSAVMVEARDGGIAAGTIHPELRTLLGQLKSDDQFNKALSPGHLKNVKEVESLLVKAQGFIDIGDFDSARKAYEQVLSIDRFNQAARRGMEQTDRLIADYGEVARNHTRSSMLGKVNAGWGTPIPPNVAGAGGASEDFGAGMGTRQASIEKKLASIVIPQVEFQTTPLQNVVEYLIQISQELDTTESDPQYRGLNIVIDNSQAVEGAGYAEKPLSLRLNNAPLGTVLKYAAQQAGMKYRVDPYAVTLIPLSASDESGLITQTYLVPPGFLSGGGGAGGGGDAGPADPFANAPAGGGGGATVIRKVSARQFLEERGVTFPEGSTASFNPVNSSLLVRNTSANINVIESMIINARKDSGKQVKVDFRLIRIVQQDLRQLGFEWMLGPFNMNQANSVFGAGGTYGSAAPAAAPVDFPFVAPDGTIVGQNPLTGGLRHNAPEMQSLDSLLQDTSFDPLSIKAPGVFGIAGVFTDPQFQTVIRALNQGSGADRLIISSVTVNPGETAKLSNVREFIYPSEYDPPDVPNGSASLDGLGAIAGPGLVAVIGGGGPVTPAHPTSFVVRELGDLLEVTPTIGDDDYAVSVAFKIDITEFLGFIDYGGPILTGTSFVENEILMPLFESIRHNISVTIYDGSTLVLGGLIGETLQHIHDKTPFLGDAPIIGRLFQSEIKSSNKTAIMLFATVRVLDPSGMPLHDLSNLGATAGAATAAAALAN